MKINSEKEIQKRVNSIYYSDGFIDINLGIMVVFYVLIHNSSGWVKYSLFGIVFVVLISNYFLKRAIAFPRTGVIVPNLRTSRSAKAIKVILGSIIFIGIIAFVFALNLPPSDIENPELVIELLFLSPILIMVILLAFLARCYRLFIDLAIICVGFSLNFYLDVIDLEFFGALSMITAGSVIILIGLVYLIHFLQKNQIKQGENYSDNQR